MLVEGGQQMTIADYACCYEYCKITMMQGERAERSRGRKGND